MANEANRLKLKQPFSRGVGNGVVQALSGNLTNNVGSFSLHSFLLRRDRCCRVFIISGCAIVSIRRSDFFRN